MLNLRVFGLGFSRVPPPAPPPPRSLSSPILKRSVHATCTIATSVQHANNGVEFKQARYRKSARSNVHPASGGTSTLQVQIYCASIGGRMWAFSVVQCFVPLLHMLWRWTAAGKTAQTCMKAVHCSAEQRSWAMRPGKKHLRKPGEGFRPKSR